MKPKGCTHPNCEKCKLPDCEYDIIGKEDFDFSNQLDYEIRLDGNDKFKAMKAQKRYRNSNKFKQYKISNKEKYDEYRRKYMQKESAKMLSRQRNKRYSERMTNKLGIPLGTFKDYKKKFGISEKDVESGMIINRVSTDGRIKIPKKFFDNNVIGYQDYYKIYNTEDGKLIIERIKEK